MSKKELLEKLKAWGVLIHAVKNLKEDDGNKKVFETEREAFIAERDMVRALEYTPLDVIESLTEDKEG